MKSTAVILMLLPAASFAQEAVALDAHKNEAGRLVMSFAETEFSLTLEVPSTDIIGFDHTAENENERAEVAAAISDLSKPLSLFEISPDAGCVTASANVALVGDAFGQEEGQDADEPTHFNEFQADYLVQCQDVSAVTSIRFVYFERFTNAQRLKIELTSDEDRQILAVERGAPVLVLPD